MDVVNVHERKLEADPQQVGALIDSLATVQVSPGLTSAIHTWSSRAKILRWVISGDKARPQFIASNTLPAM